MRVWASRASRRFETIFTAGPWSTRFCGTFEEVDRVNVDQSRRPSNPEMFNASTHIISTLKATSANIAPELAQTGKFLQFMDLADADL